MTAEEATISPSRRAPGPGLRWRGLVTRRNAGLVWLTVLVPFVVTVLVNGPAGGLMPHGTYHLVYVAIICVAVFALLRWRSRSTGIAARLMLLVAALQAFAAIGHVGEWASTLSDDRYEEPGVGIVTGDEALHGIFANVTVPALAASILLVIAITIVVWRDGRRER